MLEPDDFANEDEVELRDFAGEEDEDAWINEMLSDLSDFDRGI